MAQNVATTTWSHVKAGGATFSVTLSQAATVGNTLVFVCAGGAIATVTGFTKRTTYGSGAQDVSISDKVAVGGETSLAVSLNGAENVSGIVYELGAGLTFNAASNNGAGVTNAQASDFQVAPTASVAVSSSSLIVAVWSASTAVAYSAANRFRQMGPLGKIYATAGNQTAGGLQFIWASGLADVDASHQYPQNLAAGNYRATSTYLTSTTCFAAQVAYTDTSGVATVPAYANAIVSENTLPGTDNGNWFLSISNSTNSTIAGYTDKASYAVGDTVNFKVDSTSNPFRVEIYRLGFYGWDSYGARNMLGNQAGYITGTVTAQPAPTVDGTLGSTSCAWTTNATWTVPSGTPSGIYYVLFRRTDVTTQVSVGHFVVRSSSVSSKTVVVTPDSTHQAYNVWGATTNQGNLSTGTWTGRSLYQIGTDGATSNFAHRSYAVSFDRPYSTPSTASTTYLFDSEFGLLLFLEAQGYNTTYLSDIDLDSNAHSLDTASLVIISGHHEYWTATMYSAFQNAILAGVNTFINSSNTGGWHTRFAAGDTNKRTLICYKDSATADVSAGWSGTGYDPVSFTGSWRDTRTNAGTVNNTDIRRENALTGQLFVASGPIQTGLSVPFASKGSPIWRNSSSIQALTTGQTYNTPVNVIGYELDAPDGSAGQPGNLVNVSPMSFSYTTGSNANETIYTTSGTVTVGFTIYRSGSGALVFNTGNWRGWVSVTRWQLSTSPSGTIDLNWQNALLAILYDLGQAPSTLQSMQPGQDTAFTDPSVGAPVSGQTSVAKAYSLAIPVTSEFMSFFG
ncbi:MAG TPA: N,N-dimethylformamidase beta subunit family domain-containing protein [Patescibacteria group bacterium]|jgi:hypothetical protein|nr:N,N-dimethylformamidase beta subunit family domain-containing protein [Patescibacteria group bacterium]